jgi:outer membrane murein-binding lipoprotein Lpp
MAKLRAVVVLAAVLVCGCAASQQQIDQWKEASASMSSEIAALQADLTLIEDPVERAKLQQRLGAMQPIVERLNSAVQQAETAGDVGWNVADAAAGLATGFFPMLAPLWLAIRAAKRQRKTVAKVFESVNAGGGPQDPDAARATLSDDPAAYTAFKRWKNGVG